MYRITDKHGSVHLSSVEDYVTHHAFHSVAAGLTYGQYQMYMRQWSNGEEHVVSEKRYTDMIRVHQH